MGKVMGLWYCVGRLPINAQRGDFDIFSSGLDISQYTNQEGQKKRMTFGRSPSRGGLLANFKQNSNFSLTLL
jgi:hypothetical protein